MTMKRLACFATPLATSALLLFAAGCGGGASDKPTVVVKSDKAGGGHGGPTTPENDAPAASGYGTFTGRVVLTGGTPAGYPPNPLVVKGTDVRDAAVCAADNIPDEKIIINDGGLANVFLYLSEAPDGGKDTRPAEPPEFDQKQCTFIPHAMVVHTSGGSEPPSVLVKSSDPIPHNVKTNPAAAGNREFNQIMEEGAEPVPLSYRRREQIPVRIECNYHTWMKAWHLPLDHPYGTVTGADGSFTINDLPVGKHYFKIWHEQGGILGQHFVEITEDGQVVQETIEVGAEKVASFKGPQPKTLKLTMGR